ncbi:MAG: Alpha-glucosidase [Clostridia bacterium]|jgi:alpha-glucosidase|uniref:glycoside hydrolase family 31 protein n=1 Tax=Petroclostridium xylanilyticum TaxID=1792311 RepID=UPI000B998F5D|nr:glycoside hydrolase family 31 protein [Petroclostridium xylanilyticum]MBZ4644905.1 Alpha-glucosidase [Clostridia bacterium]
MNSEVIMDRGRAIENDYIYLGNVAEYVQNENLFRFRCGKTEVLIKVLAEDIIRILMKPNEVPSLDTTQGVIFKDNKEVEINATEFEDKVIINTNKLKMQVNKIPFGVEIYDYEGDLIYKSYDKCFLGWKGKNIACFSEIREEERFYGFGEKAGTLDKRGESLSMWNTDIFDPHNPHTKELYVSIPFFIGLAKGKSYGIFLDNPSRTHFNMGEGQDKYYSFEAEAGKLDYYFIYGPEMKRVVSRYTDITGKMPLPPKWALGYHQSKYSYSTEEEVKELANNFRKKEIPCDVIHLDIHYMDEYRVFTWNLHRFPDPEKMIQDLKEMGFHIVNIVNPGVKKDPEYKYYVEGMLNNYFCKKIDGSAYIGRVWPGESAFPDFTKQETRKWWGKNHKAFTDIGIEGIWNDMNEPAVFRDEQNGGLEDKTMDLDVIHDNDGKPATHRELHNLYGMLVSRSTYEGLKGLLKGKRPFVLTRAGYSGIQRYAAVWTGDNRSFWEHLSMTMPMVMNMGLSGIPFAGPDAGGFMGNSNGELLTRWIQLGVFTPFFRNHNSINQLSQEPWAFGEKYEKIIKEYIRLRYKLMPHLYSIFYEASITGIPVMRPLVLEYQDDPEVYNLNDEFLVGDSILVAPICKPDTKFRVVYLPKGIWYDYWTKEKYVGGKYIMIYAPLDRLPIFIKRGAIIPMAPALNYMGEKEIKELTFEIYADTESRYTLYEDDGETFEYEEGKYSLTYFECKNNEKQIIFKISSQKTDFDTGRERYILKFNDMEKKPEEVKCNEKMLEEVEENQMLNGKNYWYFNGKERVLYVIIKDSKPEADTIIVNDTCAY